MKKALLVLSILLFFCGVAFSAGQQGGEETVLLTCAIHIPEENQYSSMKTINDTLCSHGRLPLSRGLL